MVELYKSYETSDVSPTVANVPLQQQHQQLQDLQPSILPPLPAATTPPPPLLIPLIVITPPPRLATPESQKCPRLEAILEEDKPLDLR
jgi:hypothetical protein